MEMKKRKEETIAERWRSNHGNALLIIGIGMIVVGASGIRLHFYKESMTTPEPETLGKDIRPSLSGGGGKLLLQVTGFATDEGSCVVELHRSDSHDKPAEDIRWTTGINGGEVHLERTIARGQGYLKIFHDINDNGVYEREGPAPEPFVFSNSADGDWDDPNVELASFMIGRGVVTQKLALPQP